MVVVSEIRNGMLVKLEGQLFKVLSFDIHGAARAARTVHAKFKNLSSGVVAERRFRADERLEDVTVESTRMEYLYSDGPNYFFMNTNTYEQLTIPEAVIGRAVKYLRPNQEFSVELYEGRPIHVVFPKWVEVTVEQTPPGITGQADTTYKEAVLENGAKILVPQFIRTGDVVKVEVETDRYVDRVSP